jgi:hypothetical protein
MALQPALSIRGRIAVASTRPSPPIDLSSGRILVAPFDAPRDTLAYVGVAEGYRVGRDGAFEVTGLAPGSYLVTGSLGTGSLDTPVWQLASVTVDGREVVDLPMEVPPGVGLGTMVVTFTDESQHLSGALRDAGGRPLTASTVLLFSTDQWHWYRHSRRILTARPATDGRYDFSVPVGPPAGEYFLAVVADLEPDQQYEPAFLAALTDSSPIRITIAPGEKKTQDLKARR